MEIISVNNSPEERFFWFQFFDKNILQEEKAIIEANSKLTFKIPDEFKAAIKIKTLSQQKRPLEFFLTCGQKSKLKLSSYVSTSGKILNPNQDNSVTLAILNLYFQKQDVLFYFLDENKNILKKTTYHFDRYLESKVINLEVPKFAHEVVWKSLGRIHMNNPKYIFEDHTTHFMQYQNKSYFLVSNKEKNQSFVISLTDYEKIKQAREIIEKKQKKLIIANFTLGHQFENRDFYNILSLPWSWSINEVIGFNDVSLIDCDGSPELIEERGPIQSQKICFWNYFLEKELSVDEIQTGVLTNSSENKEQQP